MQIGSKVRISHSQRASYGATGKVVHIERLSFPEGDMAMCDVAFDHAQTVGKIVVRTAWFRAEELEEAN